MAETAGKQLDSVDPCHRKTEDCYMLIYTKELGKTKAACTCMRVARSFDEAMPCFRHKLEQCGPRIVKCIEVKYAAKGTLSLDFMHKEGFAWVGQPLDIQLHSPNICETCVRAMGNVCQCCGAREKDPSLLPDYASGGNSQHGFALAKNDRCRMEDAVSISDNVAGHACFAVFDGHGGEKATVLAKQFLPLQLEKHLEQESSKEEAAHQAFAAMDEQMQKQLAEEAKVFTAGTSSGTVACVALLQEEELVLLNLGDCRAVVCENGKVGTTTRDHHPEKNDQEKQRLEELGVCIEGGYVDGKVQVSRALGDIVDKTGQKILGLSNTPEVTSIQVKKTTEFVILATDGVWDGLREQLAITTARKVLRETKSAEGAAKAVLEAAGKVTKADNAAVIVVPLNIPEPLPKRDAPPSRFQRSSKTE